MNLYSSELYMEDVLYVSNMDIPWDKLKDRSILLSGATGLIGSFLVDVIMTQNTKGLNCSVFGLTRDCEKARNRFINWNDNNLLHFVSCDINNPLVINDNSIEVDYVLHLASNTHPLQYSSDPIGTITTNVLGLYNMLNFALNHRVKRFVFTSSNEIYGENRGDVELFNENYCGYINSNTIRAGYPESKRCGEALCQAYKLQKGMDIVIPRVTRSYGPTMSMGDSKAISQFIKKAIAKERIVLKSSGNQYYSYTYVADAVSGILFVMLKGNNGDAYNIADEQSDITLKDLASLIADISDSEVVFEQPDVLESAGYSTVTKARLDGKKIKQLGWKPKYDIRNGVFRTISIMTDSSLG